MVSYATKFPKIGNLCLSEVLTKLQPKFQTTLGRSTLLKKELGFKIYVGPTGLITTGAEIPGYESSITFPKEGKKTNQQLVGVFHAHPSWFFNSCRPSGSTGSAPPSDVDTAKSTDFKNLFFLVGTYINPPPKGFDPVIHEYTRSLKQYTASGNKNTISSPTPEKNWQMWVVYNNAAKKTDF
ncbi:uncharacterized protein TRIVIDRAFT_70854 [Trichoderma virens Gv29-8]|uniref:Uncharacterized protein n=1 Tax=Hypocrea virens (strain Gv29-8 / FGSC 10586) TaxID=413071 RepID=G9MUG5_HYPVG|nr:uncharacterized protein TRIVIDRAFT_70854 [Trichoderma virens Gv29-8]EHK21909.1 hypothetical protein TRIVIDRAFT_70854 [Trichoderma virens Gv29-8]UKZ54356.1 hypothetical protein TrVGV298_008164 [Trichoderma virens]